MPQKLTRNIRLFERQDEWLDTMADRYGSDRSTVVRRAIDFYSQYGIENDKKLDDVESGEVTVILRLFKRQDDWLDNLKEYMEVNKSDVVRRAIDFYHRYGIENDDVLARQATGET